MKKFINRNLSIPKIWRIILITVFVFVIFFGFKFIYPKFQLRNQIKIPPSSPVPSSSPSLIPLGWKQYSGFAIFKPRAGFPARWKFIYPDNWEVNNIGSLTNLIIKIGNNDVGTLMINPGGHGGGGHIKIIREVTEKYPAGSVQIAEALYPDSIIKGAFWFIDRPNGGVLQPVFGFEFKYNSENYEELKPLFTQILNSVVVSY